MLVLDKHLMALNSMRKLIGLFVLLLHGSAYGQPVPKVMQGDQYPVARQKLFQAGWQTHGGPNRKGCSEQLPKDVCKKFNEFAYSSTDGYCKFIWRNMDGKLLGITTYPCTSPNGGTVTGWRWEKD